MLQQQLSDPVPPAERDGFGAVGIDQQHFDLPAVPRVNGARSIAHGDTVLRGKTAARVDQPHPPLGDGDREPSGHQTALPRLQGQILSAEQVSAGVVVVGVARKRQLRVQLLDREVDTVHTNESTESAWVAAPACRHSVRRAIMVSMNSDDPLRDDLRYREKLWPGWWLWVAAVVIGASVSIAFFPVGILYGVIALVIGIALCVAALLATTPTVEVSDDQLRVGRARIGRQHLGRVAAHRGDAAREQLGPGFDARSYQCIRGWIDAVITVEVSDPQDPTPYWLFSTRHPQTLLATLGSQEPVHETGVSISRN